MTLVHKRERLIVEELATDCLDVNELNRKGLLNERTLRLRPPLRWPQVATMRVDRYVVEVNFCNLVTPQYLHLSWTPCHFGSYRPWMFCPHCRKRVARLFFTGAGYFCRACVGNPPYESQLRNAKSRAYLKAYRLRQRLGGSRPLNPIPERPYRMRRKTYDSICAEIERLERLLVGSRLVKRAPLWIRPLSY
jgi:hypothetical protein